MPTDMEGKRKLSTPIKTPRKIKIYRPSGTTPRKRLTNESEGKTVKKTVGYAARCIEHYEYRKAFTYLYNNFSGARRAVDHVVKIQIRKGVQQILKDHDLNIRKECNFENIQNFKWSEIMKVLEKYTPLLSTALVSAVTTKKNETSLKGYGIKSLRPRIGLAASVLLHSRSPSKVKFIQGMNSVELWRCGAQRKLFQHFNHLGLCTSHSTALRLVSRIRVKADEEVVKMKENIQEQMATGFVEPADLSLEENAMEEDNSEDEIGDIGAEQDSECTTTTTTTTLSDIQQVSHGTDVTDSSEEMATDSTAGSQSPGFFLVWDNVGKMVRATHQSTNRQNKMMLWALSYCAENRIPTLHLDNDIVKKATDIAVDKFLPMAQDIEEIRHRMKVIITRIIIQEIPFFKTNFAEYEQKHIRHKFWRESAKKSVVINLGVCQENPSTAAGTIKILENLQQYVPTYEDELMQILCFGDGLSCERHNDAHMARSNGASKLDRLQGLQPQVQEFHKRMLLMQDLMDIFYNGSSAAEKGTLAHLKNAFGHRSVTKDVGETFNHAADFINFVTHGYVTLACMKVCEFLSLDDGTNVHEINDKKEYLDSTVEKIIDLLWHDPKTQDIVSEVEGEMEPYNFCNCKTDLGDESPMIHCSGVSCPGKNWFHLQCIGMDVEDVPDGDYYCSRGCRRRKHYRYCCNVDLGPHEPMIGCDNEGCVGEWFHLKCRGLKNVPSGKWFCSNKCKQASKRRGKKPDRKKEDGCFNYVTSLTYMGLMDLVRRDAVRENDGEAMMSHWRLDMIQFHNRHHPKYVLLGHRLLAGVAGWLQERLRMDSIWNRTVNLAGGSGRNLEGDIVNEFLNKEFKESLKTAGGNLTEETVYRHSQMVGSLGRVLDKAYLAASELEDRSFIRRTKPDRSSDISLFVKMLHKENLFDERPGREFRSFPRFKYSVAADRPHKLREKITQLSKRLEKIRKCTKS